MTPTEAITALEKALEAGPTPGAWRTDPDYSADVQTADGRLDLCTAEAVGYQVGKGYDSPSTVREAHANAAFIAAANPLAIRTLLDAHAGALRDAEALRAAPRVIAEVTPNGRVACEMRDGRDDVFADPPSMTAEPSDPAYSYALSLATTLWARYYKAQSPNWQPLRDTLGLLTQIDNMIAGIPAYARVSSLVVDEDTQRLDWLEERRVSIIPEFEGPWDATVYGDEGEPQSVASGNTPRAAIDAARAALATNTKGAAE